MFQSIELSHSDRVSTIALSNPPLNLITPLMLTELAEAFSYLGKRSETRCVVVRGAGKRAFSAGADLGDEARHSVTEGRRFREAGRGIVDMIESFPKPVVAAIAGWCIGGGTGLAWPCDVRIASASTRFRAGDAYLGIIPTWSVGLVRLVHYLGRNRTLDLLLLGEDVTADRAYEIGLVSAVVPDEEFDAEVARVALRLGSAAPLAISAIKEAVRAQYQEGFAHATELEEVWTNRVLSSADAAEGIAAFREKRQPHFVGM